MKDKKINPISIVTIACFVSILFIPIGLVLMIYYTQWPKKLKLGIGLGLAAAYAALLVLFFFFKPSNNEEGVAVNLTYTEGSTEFQTDVTPDKEVVPELQPQEQKTKNKKKGKNKTEGQTSGLTRSGEKSEKKDFNRWLWPLLFFLIMLYLIIHQNLKNKKEGAYDNPYVDTDKYVLPFTKDTKFPIVHFLRLQTNKDEKILFATETNQPGKEGDFVVTNQRVVIMNLKEFTEFPLPALTAIASTTNSVIKLTSGDKDYYIFMPESQMKYALATVRWAYLAQLKD